MTYNVFIDRFIHPFIIYVVVGTLATYLLTLLIIRLLGVKDARARAVLYSISFLVPIASYLIFRPFATYNCILFKRPFGLISTWLCSGGKILASVLTPLFFAVTVFAVFKAGLSLFATRRITRKYGYSSLSDYPKLFSMLEALCSKSTVDVPRIIVTKDLFARSFTMGYKNPVIVFSEGLLNSLDDDELETVIAHELGHVVWADSVLNWVTVLLRDIMFFTPLTFLIFRRLAAEKEQASDDFAIKLTNKPLAFAHALIKVWKLSPRTLFNNLAFDNFMPHPNFINSSGVLELRVKRIIENEHSATNTSFVTASAILLLTVLSLWFVYWFC